jgi:hypothetical protein
VTTIWFPPKNFNEEVVFSATIVKEKRTFWVNQLSKVIAISHLSVNQDSVPNEHLDHHKVLIVIYLFCSILTHKKSKTN